MYLRILDGYTGIAHGLGLGMYGVASLVRLLIFIELHLEGRTLVLLHTEANVAVIGADGVATIQLTCRQRELYAALAVAVGGGLLFSNYTEVGIAQLKLHRLATDGGILGNRQLFPYDGGNRNGLARTIDSAVGKQVGMFDVVLTLVIAVGAVHVLIRAEIVISAVCKES